MVAISGPLNLAHLLLFYVGLGLNRKRGDVWHDSVFVITDNWWTGNAFNPTKVIVSGIIIALLTSFICSQNCSAFIVHLVGSMLLPFPQLTSHSVMRTLCHCTAAVFLHSCDGVLLSYLIFAKQCKWPGTVPGCIYFPAQCIQLFSRELAITRPNSLFTGVTALQTTDYLKLPGFFVVVFWSAKFTISRLCKECWGSTDTH